MTQLIDIVQRPAVPDASIDYKIPWDDPAFSRRMLKEHLSQEHDAASRRAPLIDQHVEWIHKDLLKEQVTALLDLGCGPGLYTTRLAQRGHTCVGLDFSPASIDYASQQAQHMQLSCEYRLSDLRTADYGTDYGFAMLIFGEFNAFNPNDARQILQKAHAALALNGLLLLEVHTVGAVRRMGEQMASWSASQSGLFSDQPHLLLWESFWQPPVAIWRCHVIDAQTAAVTSHANSIWAYEDEGYRELLQESGFGMVEFQQRFAGDDFFFITAHKNG